MSVLNGELSIRKSLDSIVRQNYSNIEIILCDDGSTDRTFEIISEFKNSNTIDIIILRNTCNIGLPSSLNRCLEIARGEYVARLDADDEMYPRRIEQQVNYLNSNSSISVVGGAQLMHFSDGSKKINRPPRTDNLIKAGLFVRTTMLHPTVMMRRDFLDRNGIKYNPEFHLCEDYKIFVDLLYAGANFANLPNIVNTYDYSTKKGWDKHQDRMVIALSRIWSENLRQLSIDDNEDSIKLLLKLSGKLKVNGMGDILSLVRLFLNSLQKNSFTFGTKGAFLIARVKDIIIMMRSITLRKL